MPRPNHIACVHDVVPLERALIDDYLLTRTHDPDALWVRRAPQARCAKDPAPANATSVESNARGSDAIDPLRES